MHWEDQNGTLWLMATLGPFGPEERQTAEVTEELPVSLQTGRSRLGCMACECRAVMGSSEMHTGALLPIHHWSRTMQGWRHLKTMIRGAEIVMRSFRTIPVTRTQVAQRPETPTHDPQLESTLCNTAQVMTRPPRIWRWKNGMQISKPPNLSSMGWKRCALLRLPPRTRNHQNQIILQIRTKMTTWTVNGRMKQPSAYSLICPS